MSSESLIITVGAAVGSAIAALGSVEQRMARLGDAAVTLTARQHALGASMSNLHGPAIGNDLARMNAQYAQLGTTIDRLNASQTRLGQQQSRATQLRAERGNMRSDALDTVALGASVVMPIKLAVDFESAMADVRKVVDFDTPDGVTQLGNEILKMSRTLPVAATDLAAIAASGGQLGVAAKDLPKFTDTIAKMAVAFDMGAEDAGDSMAKLANVYKIPIASIGKLGDAINQLSNESPAKASDIVRTLSRVGGVAKAFGLTELQTASLSNAFISLGKAPEVAGTAINGMLTKLVTADKQGKDFQAGLKTLGLTASGLKKSIGEDAQGALLGFLKTVEKLPKADRMGVLVDLFGLEYADDVAVLAGSVNTYSDSIETLNKTKADGSKSYDGSMEREFATRAATSANNAVLLKNNLRELGIVVGSVVLPALNGLVNDIRPAVTGLTDWAQAHQGLVKLGFKTVAFLAAAKAGSLGLRYGFNLLASGTNNVFTVFEKIKGAHLLFSAARLANVSHFGAALQAMGVQAATAQRVTDGFSRAGGMIRRVVQAAPARVARVGAAVRHAPAAMVRGAWRGTVRTGQALGRGAVRTGQMGTSVVLGTYRLGTSAVVGSLHAMRHPLVATRRAVFGLDRALRSISLGSLRGMGAVLQGVGAALRMAFMPIMAIGLPALVVIGAIAATAFLVYKYWKPIKAFFTGMWQGIQQGLKPLQPLFDALSLAAGKLFEPLKPVWGWLKTALGGIVSWFGKVFKQEEDVGGGAAAMGVRVGAAIAGFINGAVALATTVVTKFGVVVDWFKSLPAAFMSFGQDIMQGLLDGISSRFDSVVNKIKSVGAAIKSVFTGSGAGGQDIHSPSRVWHGFGGFLMSGLGGGIEGQSTGVLSKIQQLGASIQTAFAPKLSAPQVTTPSAATTPHAATIVPAAPIAPMIQSPMQPLNATVPLVQVPVPITLAAPKHSLPRLLPPLLPPASQKNEQALIGFDAHKPLSTLIDFFARLIHLGAGVTDVFSPKAEPPVKNKLTDVLEGRVQVSNNAAPATARQTSRSAPLPQISFNPTIHVNGDDRGSSGVKEQVEQGLAMGMRELESLIKRLTAEQLRKAF